MDVILSGHLSVWINFVFQNFPGLPTIQMGGVKNEKKMIRWNCNDISYSSQAAAITQFTGGNIKYFGTHHAELTTLKKDPARAQVG